VPDRVFGEIPGVPVGSTFTDRASLADAGIHRPHMAGISGSEKEGADSIVLSGGYEDDIDEGDFIIYTGHGGNDPNTGKQVADQTLTRQNLALAKNATTGLPVRVSRGSNLDSPHVPSTGLRYDGLYRVEEYWHEKGRSGFEICRFRLVREDEAPAPWASPPTKPLVRPERRPVRTLRIVRNTAITNRVKELHGYRCQVCGVRLETPAGPYAEGAHIRPLGEPHNGPDQEDNVLCLCPNHHVLFDLGAFTIGDDFSLHGLPGVLRTAAGHEIDKAQLAYHRLHFGIAAAPGE
jgi:putative restriction endonuclease